jgi:hypothetical protein
MKPAIWRIFRNGRWSYSDSPSTRSEDRAAWQPLYAQPEKGWDGLTDEEIKSLLWETRVDNLTFARVIEKVLREKNAA